MKNKYIITAAITVMFAVSGCQGFLEDINENPNEPTEVNPKVLLPAAQGSLAYTQGGDMSRFTGIFTQYITGGSRQFFGYNRYIFSEEDFNNLWNNIYAGAMKDLDDIMDYSDANAGSYTVYGGVARILMAYCMGITTDCFGDIPYNDAFQGNENLKPAYNSQEEIYNTIQSLLTQGIDSLANDPGDDLDSPFESDLIYEGDLTLWIQFAHALKARYYMNLSDVDDANIEAALAEAALGMTGNGDNSKFIFSSSAPGPWYQYIEQRDDILYDGFCIQTMLARNDLRQTIYIDQADEYWGTGYLGPFWAADNSPVYFMTYAEQKFIEAEAHHLMGDDASAQTDLTEAISANFAELGLAQEDADAYILDNALLTGTADENYAVIMYEKYVAMFLHPQAWSDWRRTDLPALTPNDGVLPEIPRRFIYPTNERLYNPNGVNQGSTLLNPRLWWDTF